MLRDLLSQMMIKAMMSLKITFLLGLSVCQLESLISLFLASLEIGSIKNKGLIKLKSSSNCWICEGWTEFKFTFKTKE